MKKVLAMILSTVMILTMAVFAAPSPAAAATVSSYDVTVYFTGSEGLALKYTPDENAGKYFNIPEGTSLHIDNVSSGWGQTSYNGCTGWVSLRYTRITGDYPTPQPSSGYISPVYYTVYNTEGEGLELRTSPTTSSSTFGPMYDGTVIKAEAVSGEWVYGSWNGHYGWCHTAYLRGSYASEIETYEARVRQQAQTNVQPVISAGGGYAQAYIDILFAWEGEIEQYDWQHTDSASMPVVLCDITNDGIPELIFICAVQDEYALIPQLRIYTYENEEARELFADTWGHQKWAGGYSFYYLFLMTGKPSLYYYTDNGDDGGTTSYGRFDTGADGTLVMTDLFRDRDFGSPYDNQHEYYKQNTSITAEEYQEQIRYAQSLTERILMYSDGCGEFAESFIAQNGCSAMTVSEAIEQLGSQTDTGAQITFEQEAAAATYSTWLPDGAYGQWQAAAGEYYTVTDEYVIYTAYQDDETGEIMMQEYFSYDVSQNGDVYEMYCDNGNYAFTAQYRNESLYIPFWRNGGTELYQYFKVG